MNKINKLSILIPILLLVILSITFIYYKSFDTTKTSTSYKTFLQALNNGTITDVYLSDQENMKITFKNGKTSYTENPRSQNLKEELLLKGVNVHESSSNSPSDIVPMVLFFTFVGGFLYMLMRGKSSRNSLFKMSVSDASVEEYSSISFDSIAGNDEVKESIKELVDFIKTPEKYTRYDAKIPRGVILYGPPGTGKTLVARALASEAGVPFYAVSGSDFVQIYVGVGAGRIRDLFKKAREKGKAVIFIDEIDAIGKKRSGTADGGSDERDQTLNALLAEMSGFNETEGIIVIAATNRLDVLDDALLRPGRFDRHLEVGLPDVNARHKILQLHSNSKPLSEEVDLQRLAKMTVYFSGAKLESLLNEAAIIAAKKAAPFITSEDIDKAYSTVLAGFEKVDHSYITDIDRRATAYHEAGHALTSKLLCPENLISRVTIIPSTKGAGGYTINIPPDRMYKTKMHLIDEIKIALGGRAAEEIIFGKDNISTGAYGDLAQATKIALSMIMSYGMLEGTGLISYEVLSSFNLINSKEIIIHCNNLLSDLYNEVLHLLKNNTSKLEALTNLLLINETIGDEDFYPIMN